MYTVLPLGQVANIRTVDAMRVILTAAFQREDKLELDAADLEDVDLTFVQLVEAARQHADREGKEIRLAAPANPALTGLLRRAGMIDAAASGDLDFWFHGDLPQ